MEINRYLDHAVLKPDMTPGEARAAIQTGIDYAVKTVCVRPCDIEMALFMCAGTQTRVSCVLDFPHGCGGKQGKAALAGIYAAQGVCEIDMVMNYGAAKGGAWDAVEEEIRLVCRAAHDRGAGVKVILETACLTLEEIRRGVEVSAAAGADFVKTSTGFGPGGATEDAVKAMIEAAKGRIRVKPSGGIRTYADAKKYVEMGADRLGVGCGSTPAICEGQEK